MQSMYTFFGLRPEVIFVSDRQVKIRLEFYSRGYRSTFAKIAL